MFPEQKPKSSALAISKLFLAVVILICFSTVLGVAGYLTWNKQVKNLQPQFYSTLTPAVSIKDEIADWQIYKNDKYGFEAKYPLEFIFNTTGPNISQEAINKGEQIAGSVAPSFDTIIFSGKNNRAEEKFYVSIFHPDEKDISVKNYDDYLYVSGPCDTRWGFEPLAKKMERFNNIDVLEVNGKTSEGSRVGCNYFKNRDNNLIVLSTDKLDNEEDFNRAAAILQKVLSTLILRDTAGTTDWKTYRNEKYGYEVKYPNSWEGTETSSITNYASFAPEKKDMAQSGFWIRVYENSNKLSIKEWWDKEYIKGDTLYELKGAFLSEGKSGFPVTVFKEKNGLGFSYYVISKESYIYIIFSRLSDDKMNQVLSIFKFTEKDLSFSCGTSIVTDVDNNIYNTVKIGSQCWLKENLKVTKNPEGKAITRYCYNNDPKICETDGGLYDWNTAMNKFTTEGSQGICPNGWHVPKDSEWYVLEDGLKDVGKTCDVGRDGVWDCDSAGKKLKVGSSSGFEGILAGSSYANRLFNYRGSGAYFWSSTEDTGHNPWYRALNLSRNTISREVYGASSFSIRCLKND